jgi:hypothetical protein
MLSNNPIAQNALAVERRIWSLVLIMHEFHSRRIIPLVVRRRGTRLATHSTSWTVLQLRLLPETGIATARAHYEKYHLIDLASSIHNPNHLLPLGFKNYAHTTAR